MHISSLGMSVDDGCRNIARLPLLHGLPLCNYIRQWSLQSPPISVQFSSAFASIHVCTLYDCISHRSVYALHTPTVWRSNIPWLRWNHYVSKSIVQIVAIIIVILVRRPSWAQPYEDEQIKLKISCISWDACIFWWRSMTQHFEQCISQVFCIPQLTPCLETTYRFFVKRF